MCVPSETHSIIIRTPARGESESCEACARACARRGAARRWAAYNVNKVKGRRQPGTVLGGLAFSCARVRCTGRMSRHYRSRLAGLTRKKPTFTRNLAILRQICVINYYRIARKFTNIFITVGRINFDQPCISHTYASYLVRTLKLVFLCESVSSARRVLRRGAARATQHVIVLGSESVILK